MEAGKEKQLESGRVADDTRRGVTQADDDTDDDSDDDDNGKQ